MQQTTSRLDAANRERYRAADEKHARRMRARGWIVIPPEKAIENEAGK